MFVRPSVRLQVNEHLRDILVEEQKLRDNVQESNSTAQTVRRKRKQDNFKSVASLRMIGSRFRSLKARPPLLHLPSSPEMTVLMLCLLLPKKRGHVLDLCVKKYR